MTKRCKQINSECSVIQHVGAYYISPIRLNGKSKEAMDFYILFEKHFVMTVPAKQAEKFDVVALVHLSDLKIESASDGKGSPARMVCGCH